MTSFYDEIASPADLKADCEHVSASLSKRRLERAAELAVEPAPSIHFDEYPTEVKKRDIKVDEAAQRLAAAIHFHLD